MAIKLYPRTLMLLAVVLAITALAGFSALHWWTNSVVEQPLNLQQPELLTLDKGQTLSRLINQLERQNVISNALGVKLWAKLNPDKTHLKSGTYEMLPGDSLGSVLADMAAGKEKQFAITLPEGQTIRQWLALVQNHPKLDKRDLTPIMVRQRLTPQPEADNIEGLLMADTYFYTANTPAMAILQRSYQAMTEFMQGQWPQRAVGLPYESAYETLIMASIIEKETGLAEERSRIAAVFVNRLHQGMRLQTDPTVIYGLGDEFDGDLTRKHLRQKTPYNTYRINGLPPTPIAMPGKAAILAALHPIQSDELYFVSRGDGSHQFSETLEQHNQAVREYQLNR